MSTNLDDLIKQFERIDHYFDQTFPQLQKEYRLLARLGKITEELGELNSAVHGELKLHREEKQNHHRTESLAEEWADVFNTVMLFGLVAGIDMPQAIQQRLATINQRLKIETSE